MKKRNEDGYVLVYVMVVVFVLCAIATALITQTIHTMAAQKKMVERMQDKYVAMGAIERAVAEIDEIYLAASPISYEDSFESSALPAGKTYLETSITSLSFVDILSITPQPNGTWEISINATHNSTSVSALLSIIPSITEIPDHIYAYVDAKDDDGNTIYDSSGNPVKKQIIDVMRYKFSVDVSLSTPTFLQYSLHSVDSTESGGEST